MKQRFESVLVVPEELATPEQFLRVVDAIAEVAFPTASDDCLSVRIEWELDENEDGWELRDKVESVRVEVEAIINRSLVWDRPR